MPDFTFHGPYDGQYPGHRDLDHQPLGLVVPGDIRNLADPLDRDWRETTDEDREALAARLAAAEAPADDAGGDGDTQGDTGAGGEDDPPPAPSAPAASPAAPPAVPAAVPAASAPAIAGPSGTTSQEG